MGECTGTGRLDEKEVLFEVGAAEELAGADDELVAFLQRPSADETSEAGQMEGQRSCPHDQFVRIKPLTAAATFGAVDSAQIGTENHREISCLSASDARGPVTCRG